MVERTERHVGRIIASPRARRALRIQGLDPRAIRGTGPGGRIVTSDMVAQPSAATARSRPAAASASRQRIARATTTSTTTIPHFYLQAEVDASRLMLVRADIAPAMESQHGIKPTITDFLLRALSLALRDCPDANSVWRETDAAFLADAHVGLVVGLEDGLSIPVITASADLLSTARKRLQAVSRVRDGQLPAAVPCASSLSNIGSGRVDAFTAVIPVGQSSILAVGRLAARPWAVDDALTVRQTLRLTLSVDHRVLDGQPAGRFLGRIVDYLEQPGRLVADPP